MEIIETKQQMNEWIDYEMSKYGGRINGIRWLFPITEYDILRKHVVLLRKTEYFANRNMLRKKIWLARLLRFQNRYCLHIPLNCCGRGLKIMHVGPILINSHAQVGKDVSIHINSALVASGISDEAPHIGDSCVIGVGAKIIGGISIANNIAIGANAVVTKSFFDENIAIAGVPAKKVSDNGRIAWRERKSNLGQ